MTQQAFFRFQSDHSTALHTRVVQITQALSEDPYEVLERSGAANTLIDAVAEQHVYRCTIAKAGSIEDALRRIDGYAVIFVDSAGPLSDANMRGRVNTWIQGWRRRLEKLQRENPDV